MSNPDRPIYADESIQEILKPVLYTDIFDYPLTFNEIYNFLEIEAGFATVEQMLNHAVKREQLAFIDGFYCLPHRTHLAAKRRERQKISETLWPQAARYGRWIAGLPFVRLVAVTGALAVNNPRDVADDIDYLIVTQVGRLWLCRAMIILMVRFGYLKGVHLCPNYLLTENALNFEDSFFVAREILQMQPLYGKACYLKIRELNTWTGRYFPHGSGFHLNKIDDELSPGQRMLKATGEALLGGYPGHWLERWLQKKQISKHTRLAARRGSLDKVIFTPDVCKGHYDGHNQKTMMTYQQHLKTYLFSQNGHRSRD